MTTRRQNKEIEAELLVWIDIKGQAVLCGVLRLDDQAEDRFFAQFNYVQSWLDNPHAFALDPLNLPLVDVHTTFSTSNRLQVLGALFDAAPDAWGRRVIRADQGARVNESEVLLKGRGMGAGAILFSASPLPDRPIPQPYPVPVIEQIETLADVLADIDAGVRPKAQYRDVLGSSWDMGGARPKAVVQDAEGQLWIAKFPRDHDTFDRQKVEYANLKMAKDIGLHVPEIQLIPTHRGAVLLSRRFDRNIQRTSAGVSIGKRHYLSGASLVNPPVEALKRQLDTPRGQVVYSYARLADIVRRISADSVKDLMELYARMVLNVAVHNTDDHLKNIGFLKEERSDHYRLAPLFDVVTQEGDAPHMLHLGVKGRESSFENALSDYRRLGLRTQGAAAAILERVQSVVVRRQQYYREAGLSAAEVDLVESHLVAWRSIPANE